MKYIAIILIILILTVSITVPLQYYMSDTQNVLRVIKKYSVNEKTKEEFRQLCKLDPTDKINVFKENVNDIEINVDDYVSSMFNTFHNVSEDDIAVLLAIYKKVQEPVFIGNASNFIEGAFYNSTNVGDETYDKPGSALSKETCIEHAQNKNYAAWGYRTEAHSKPNTCFFVKDMNFNKKVQDAGTEKLVFGCAYTDKTLKNNCV